MQSIQLVEEVEVNIGEAHMGIHLQHRDSHSRLRDTVYETDKFLPELKESVRTNRQPSRSRMPAKSF